MISHEDIWEKGDPVKDNNVCTGPASVKVSAESM